MDVGNPSNFPRLLALYGGDEELLKDHVKGYFYTDEKTVEVMQEVKNSGYTLDPHGAVGYKGLKDFMTENDGFHGVFLETAHPGKFRETVEKALNLKLELPERLAAFMDGEKKVEALGNGFSKFKDYLKGLNF